MRDIPRIRQLLYPPRENANTDPAELLRLNTSSIIQLQSWCEDSIHSGNNPNAATELVQL